MRKFAPITVGLIACGTVLALATPTAAATTPDRVIDRAFVECSRGSMLQVDLERERRKLEADVEIYASPRERWTITISQAGRVVHTRTRSANREGELNMSRYLPPRQATITVMARSATGERCTASVSP